MAKIILRKKNGAVGINFPDFTLYDKATVIKTVWYWHKNRNTAEGNKTENPEINPHTYGHLTFAKGGKNIQWRKENLFNKNCGKTRQLHVKKWREHFLTPWTKINSKWIKELNIRPQTIQLLEEIIGSTLFDINHSKTFCDPLPKEMEGKKKKNQHNLINIDVFHIKANNTQDNTQNGRK